MRFLFALGLKRGELARRYAGWTIERIREDARKNGPTTTTLCEQILEARPHPEQGYRACLGIVRLVGSFGAARVEAAAQRAIEIGARTYGSVKSILDSKLDRRPAPILDDFGLEPLDAGTRHDLLEILEERYGRRSTIVTSQLPMSAWHEVIGDPTYADAILDRLVHNAHRIELTGESLRRARGKQSKTA